MSKSLEEIHLESEKWNKFEKRETGNWLCKCGGKVITYIALHYAQKNYSECSKCHARYRY